MQALIISIGTEILMGEIIDTNSHFISKQLPLFGITSNQVIQIGDDQKSLSKTIKEALDTYDIIFLTGGLGPTQDDITREAIGEALKEKINVSQPLVDTLKEHFSKRNMEMPPRNIKQATLIKSAKHIPNDKGTAPGWWAKKDHTHIIAMPGPPSEMQYMWHTYISNKLQYLSNNELIITKTIKTTGLTEGEIAEMISDLFGKTNPYLGIYAKPDGIHLRIIAKAKKLTAANKLIKTIEIPIKNRLDKYIWGYDESSPEEIIIQQLKKKNLTLSVSEFGSGGILTSLIGKTENNQYFKGGIIHNLPSVLKQKNQTISGDPVSKATTLQLAKNIKKEFDANIGIGLTCAIESQTTKSKIGMIFVAIIFNENIHEFNAQLPPRRELIQNRAASISLIELSKCLNTLN